MYKRSFGKIKIEGVNYLNDEASKVKRLEKVIDDEYDTKPVATLCHFLENNKYKLFWKKGELLSGGSLKVLLYESLSAAYAIRCYLPCYPTLTNVSSRHSSNYVEYAEFVPLTKLNNYVSMVFRAGICMVKKGETYTVLPDNQEYRSHIEFMCKVITNYCIGLIDKESEPFIYSRYLTPDCVPNFKLIHTAIVSNVGVNIRIVPGLLNEGLLVSAPYPERKQLND